MRQSATYQEIYEKGIEKRMEKGREKGREKGIAESIFEYVLAKYGFVSDEFRSMVESESNLEVLKDILKGLYLDKRPEDFLERH